MMPGLGHVYNGEPGFGLLAYLLQPVFVVIGSTLFFSTFHGMVAVLALALVLYLGIAIHAALRARRLGEIQLRWYNRAVVYLLIVAGVSIPAGLIFKHIVIPALPYRAYFTRSGSMEPTLRVGDHFFVDTWAYRKKPPQRGDVIVFTSPEDPTLDLIERCVAVGGDSVEIRDKRLSINGQPVAEPYARHIDPTVHQDDGMTPFGKRDQLRALTVPPSSCFVLGDNRDNSYDSRFYGSVHDDLLKAKALYVYWGKSGSRIGQPIR
jgi:signal peptidase I